MRALQVNKPDRVTSDEIRRMSDHEVHQKCKAEVAKDPAAKRRYEEFLDGWLAEVQQMRNPRYRGMV